MVRIYKTLDNLNIGETAKIRDVDVSNPTAFRLLELGFIPGTEITLLNRAPLGDPSAFEIRGYKISLRASEASLIKVEVQEHKLPSNNCSSNSNKSNF